VNLDPSAFVADPDLILDLEKQSSPIFCDEDRSLFRIGDDSTGLYILKSGAVTLTLSSATGKVLASIQAAAGSLLGLPALVGDQPYTLTAIAHPGARLSYLTRDNFNDLVRNDALLFQRVLEVLAAEIRAARSAIL